VTLRPPRPAGLFEEPAHAIFAPVAFEPGIDGQRQGAAHLDHTAGPRAQRVPDGHCLTRQRLVQNGHIGRIAAGTGLPEGSRRRLVEIGESGLVEGGQDLVEHAIGLGRGGQHQDGGEGNRQGLHGPYAGRVLEWLQDGPVFNFPKENNEADCPFCRNLNLW
jgi:hypothetical protein